MNEKIIYHSVCPICGGEEDRMVIVNPDPEEFDPFSFDGRDDELCQKCWHDLYEYVYGFPERIMASSFLSSLCNTGNPHAIALVKSLIYPTGTPAEIAMQSGQGTLSEETITECRAAINSVLQGPTTKEENPHE